MDGTKTDSRWNFIIIYGGEIFILGWILFAWWAALTIAPPRLPMASSWYDIWAVATVGWVAFMVITPWLTKRDWRHFRISLLLLIVAIVAMGVLATIEAIQLWNSFLWFL